MFEFFTPTNPTTRVKWIRDSGFDVIIHENVVPFPHDKMMGLLGWLGSVKKCFKTVVARAREPILNC